MGFIALDIILVAGLAVFLFFRLRDVLGRPSGRESLEHSIDITKAGREEAARAEAAAQGEPEAPEGEWHEDPVIDATLKQIAEKDKTFDPATFVQGAEFAYEMVIDAFAQGNTEPLRELLSSDVFADFKAAIDARAQAGETLETSLIGFSETRIDEAELDRGMATVVVRFASEQISVLKDAEGEVIEGHPTHVTPVIDRWTFVRKVTSSDPNWTLVGTDSED